MTTADKYLQPSDLAKPTPMTIRGVQKEIIDGRPRIVLYFDECEKGLILTRELADTITKAYGISPIAEAFFNSPEGQLN